MVYYWGSQMGSKTIGLFLMFFSHVYIFASSSSSLQKALPSSDSLQETQLGAKVTYRHGSTGVGDGGRNGIKVSSKFERGNSHGTSNGGGSTGTGENGSNGGSRSPQGGSNLVPVYGAGAANNHHQNHHHGSGNCNRNSVGLPILTAATLASLFAHLYLLK